MKTRQLSGSRVGDFVRTAIVTGICRILYGDFFIFDNFCICKIEANMASLHLSHKSSHLHQKIGYVSNFLNACIVFWPCAFAMGSAENKLAADDAFHLLFIFVYLVKLTSIERYGFIEQCCVRVVLAFLCQVRN